VFFVCPVWGISGMASGRIGPIHSSSDWCVRMGRLRISGNGDLRHVGGLLWFGAGFFGLHRGLHRLGYLVVDRSTPGAVNTWRPGCIFYGIATITPRLVSGITMDPSYKVATSWCSLGTARKSVRACSALSPKVISRRGTFSAISEPGQKPYVTLPSGRRVFRPFSRAAPRWPESILLGQEGFIILCGGGRGEPCQCLAVIPRYPL
jgi:hypothetical protein